MSLSDEERRIIVNRELEKAKRTFRDSVYNANGGLWEATANRLYYAIFHAVSALLIDDGFTVKSHRGIIAMFGEHYIKTGIFDKKHGSLLLDLVIMRDNADYNCFFEADEEKIKPFIELASDMIRKIENYITANAC
ncbi:MAG: HEPN domain-containing protein [Prevotella sp.]|nr:HEPN domain-containing protein [Prevotella sp.]